MDLSNYQKYGDFLHVPEFEGLNTSRSFYQSLKRRRSIRHFSSRPVEREIIENAIGAAGSAPSGANRQPWYFAVAESANIKRQIRIKAEECERQFYNVRAPESLLAALRPFGTNAVKSYLETAPYLIAAFSRSKQVGPAGDWEPTYYPKESTGLAAGILLTSLHLAGLATLTHTPNPMCFLNEIFDLDSYHKPFLLVVAGYPAEPILVPQIDRKPFHEICGFY